jgi:DNA-binding transcriptional regulator YhcF (GntR family)
VRSRWGYQGLRDEGLVDPAPGRGAVLTSAATSGRAAITERTAALVSLARGMGLGVDDVVGLVRSAFQEG